MKHLRTYRLYESEYDNRFIGKSDKSDWSESDKSYLDGDPVNGNKTKIESISNYEFGVIKDFFENQYPDRNDLIVEVKPYRLLSDLIDKIEINIYIKKGVRKKAILNSTTYITKLEDEYFWLELKNRLTYNTYNFKLDGLGGLIDSLKKL